MEKKKVVVAFSGGLDTSYTVMKLANDGYEVYAGEELIGTVTTGYQSISTGKSVCMALIDPRFAALGTEVQIQIHRRRQNGTVVKKRFYAKSYKK